MAWLRRTLARVAMNGLGRKGNVAVLVDAGYVRGSAAILLATPELPFDPGEMRAYIEEHIAVHLPGRRLLRIYWYDAVLPERPHRDIQRIGRADFFKCRMGVMKRPSGKQTQKEVDTLIALDMIELARNRVVSDFILMSGDQDFRPAVVAAQSYGVRVHLVGVEPLTGKNQSWALKNECDTTRELGRAEIIKFSGFDPAVMKLEPLPPSQSVKAVRDAAAIKRIKWPWRKLNEAAPAIDHTQALMLCARDELERYKLGKASGVWRFQGREVIEVYRATGRFNSRVNTSLTLLARTRLSMANLSNAEIDVLRNTFIAELERDLAALPASSEGETLEIAAPTLNGEAGPAPIEPDHEHIRSAKLDKIAQAELEEYINWRDDPTIAIEAPRIIAAFRETGQLDSGVAGNLMRRSSKVLSRRPLVDGEMLIVQTKFISALEGYLAAPSQPEQQNGAAVRTATPSLFNQYI
jgi:uncharacterized LabA/DUF88 family protein